MIIKTTIDADVFMEYVRKSGAIEEVNQALFWQEYEKIYGRIWTELLWLKIFLRATFKHPIAAIRHIFHEVKMQRERYIREYEKVMYWKYHYGDASEVLQRERLHKNFWKYAACAAMLGVLLLLFK